VDVISGWKSSDGKPLMDPQNFVWDDVDRMALKAAQKIKSSAWYYAGMSAYPVPRGGIYAAQAIRQHCDIELIEDPKKALIIIDDLVDSGKTRDRYLKKNSGKHFVVLLDKQKEGITEWVTFPWERMNNERGPEENIRRIIEYIGDDPKREGLLDTPKRVVKSYAEMFSGYSFDDEAIKAMMTTFEGEGYDEIILQKDIEFVSFCEHHMLPFTGVAHVAYIPKTTNRIVGLSKLARIVDVYAKRLQVQERLTQQIVKCINTHLEPAGAACVIEAKHSCMCFRGVGKQASYTITSCLSGSFQDVAATRSEFFSLIKG